MSSHDSSAQLQLILTSGPLVIYFQVFVLKGGTKLDVGFSVSRFHVGVIWCMSSTLTAVHDNT